MLGVDAPDPSAVPTLEESAGLCAGAAKMALPATPYDAMACAAKRGRAVAPRALGQHGMAEVESFDFHSIGLRQSAFLQRAAI